MAPFGISMAAAVRSPCGRTEQQIATTLKVTVIAARLKVAELFLDRSAGDADATIGLAERPVLR